MSIGISQEMASRKRKSFDSRFPLTPSQFQRVAHLANVTAGWTRGSETASPATGPGLTVLLPLFESVGISQQKHRQRPSLHHEIQTPRSFHAI